MTTTEVHSTNTNRWPLTVRRHGDGSVNLTIGDGSYPSIHSRDVDRFLADLRSAMLPDAEPEATAPSSPDAASLLLQVRAFMAKNAATLPDETFFSLATTMRDLSRLAKEQDVDA